MVEFDIWTFLNSPLFALIVGTLLIPFIIKLVQKAFERIKASENRNLYGALIIHRYTELEKVFDYFINFNSNKLSTVKEKFRENFMKISKLFKGGYNSFIPSLDKEKTFPELLLKFLGKKSVTKSSGMLSPEMGRLLRLPEITDKLEYLKMYVKREPQNPEHKSSYIQIQKDIKLLRPEITKDKIKIAEALS